MVLGVGIAASRLADWLIETGQVPYGMRQAHPLARPCRRLPRDMVDLGLLISEQRTIASSAN
jgi:hypothetical protein